MPLHNTAQFLRLVFGFQHNILRLAIHFQLQIPLVIDSSLHQTLLKLWQTINKWLATPQSRVRHVCLAMYIWMKPKHAQIKCPLARPRPPPSPKVKREHLPLPHNAAACSLWRSQALQGQHRTPEGTSRRTCSQRWRRSAPATFLQGGSTSMLIGSVSRCLPRAQVFIRN